MSPSTPSLPEVGSAASVDIEHRRLGPKALTRWLTRLAPSLCERWVEEVRRRGHAGPAESEALIVRFAELQVGLLPLMLGPLREQIQPLWDRAAELYGAMAAKRGLAAGEAIEEVHALRELVIRDLYRSPPAGGTVRLSLREILRMNRALDRAVTHTSVGHTDALFFEFFETEGSSSFPSGSDVHGEASGQLDQIEAEVREVVGRAPRRAASGEPEGR
jgi:hypothetical protein